ncbi:hypothetical protein ACF063_05840 [Streptomyces chartreusis]|uniref:hypothetical protein n=1 Tax=Streptomyces chartreusis TaxID=1969 RepID=UPI0036FC7A93
MADREEESNESAEAKHPGKEPGTPRQGVHRGAWLGITCHALGIMYYGPDVAHSAWLTAQDLANSLVQYWS